MKNNDLLQIIKNFKHREYSRQAVKTALNNIPLCDINEKTLEECLNKVYNDPVKDLIEEVNR